MAIEGLLAGGQQITMCLLEGAGKFAFSEILEHHIPSPGAELHQGGGLSGSDSGTSQTRNRYQTHEVNYIF